MTLRGGLLVGLVIALAAAGCGESATPAGTVILDWHRSSALSDPDVSLGEDVGPATEERQSGTLAVGADAVRYTITLDVGEMRSRGGDGVPPVLRGPRRIRFTVDDSRGHAVTASCHDELTLTPAAEGEGYGPDLAANCTIQVGAEAVKVFLLRAEEAVPSAPPASEDDEHADEVEHADEGEQAEEQTDEGEQAEGQTDEVEHAGEDEPTP